MKRLNGKILAGVFATMLLGACSSKQDKGSQLDEAMQVGRLNETTLQGQPLGDQDYGYGQGQNFQDVQLDAPDPGTQEDLAVNVGDRVFFGYDRHDLTGEARQVLELQARWLQQYPSTQVIIEGHADERGTREYNLALGDRRATAVRNYLIAMGVDARRIRTISYGKEQPAVLGSGPQVWAQNRRAVTIIE